MANPTPPHTVSGSPRPKRNDLEMARKAAIAEAERDAALAEVERLRDQVAEAEFHIRQITESRDRAERQAESDQCAGLCGEHHWLDRTESDTRECLICGAEVTG
jgi:hypothetical protein